MIKKKYITKVGHTLCLCVLLLFPIVINVFSDSVCDTKSIRFTQLIFFFFLLEKHIFALKNTPYRSRHTVKDANFLFDVNNVKK